MMKTLSHRRDQTYRLSIAVETTTTRTKQPEPRKKLDNKAQRTDHRARQFLAREAEGICGND
jgi:hypothetical protein